MLMPKMKKCRPQMLR